MYRLLFIFVMMVIAIPAQAMQAKVNLSRAQGLLIGDIITATIVLPVTVSELDKTSLPKVNKRYGPWLSLHSAQSLNDNTLQWQWQVVNVPDENRQIEMPKWTLRTTQSKFIDLPTEKIQIGSFLVKNGSAVTPYPDIATPRLNMNTLYWQLAIGLTVLLLSLGVWLLWYWGFRIGQKMPFASSVVALRKLRLFGQEDADAAARCLHQAFNRSTGSVVLYSDLATLWKSCPWLKPLQQDITQFYKQSADYYFNPTPSQPYEFDEIVHLAKACRAREQLA